MLTNKQEIFLKLIKELAEKNQELPDLRTIYETNKYKNYSSINNFLKQLQTKNYLEYDEKTKKITYLKETLSLGNFLEIPLINKNKFIEISNQLLNPKKKYLAFIPKYTNLKELLIDSKDILIFETDITYINNKLVLAKIDDEYKVLEYKKKDNYTYLQNGNYTFFLKTNDVVKGKLCLVIRKY